MFLLRVLLLSPRVTQAPIWASTLFGRTQVSAAILVLLACFIYCIVPSDPGLLVDGNCGLHSSGSIPGKQNLRSARWADRGAGTSVISTRFSHTVIAFLA